MKNEQTMKSFRDDYRSYLLRMWRVQVEEGSDWRASLEEVQTGELYGFPNLVTLIDYLEGLACSEREDEELQQQPAELRD
jgi:hypothetical protein